MLVSEDMLTKQLTALVFFTVSPQPLVYYIFVSVISEIFSAVTNIKQFS